MQAPVGAHEPRSTPATHHTRTGIESANKENNVANINYSDVDRRVNDHVRTLAEDAEVERRIRLVGAYGEDVYTDTTVFVFQKQLSDDGGQYTYAAIKAPNGRWYLSGHGTHANAGALWRDFVAFLISGPYPVTVVRIIHPHSGDEFSFGEPAPGAVRVDVSTARIAVVDEPVKKM